MVLFQTAEVWRSVYSSHLKRFCDDLCLFSYFSPFLIISWSVARLIVAPVRVSEITSDLGLKTFHMWGPFETRQHFCHCNIWDYVTSMFFTWMDLPRSCSASRSSPCCCRAWQTHVVSSWLRNVEQQKGKFNPCSVDLGEMLSFV